MRELTITSSDGIPIDISFGALPFEEEMIKRSRTFNFMPGVTLNVCSAEDLIIMKASASRCKDWMDVEGNAKKQEKKT